MKTKVCPLLVVVTLFADIHSSFAQPSLSIAPTNNQHILFWPANANGTNGVLESTTDLISPNWLAATDAFPMTYGSQTAVSVTNSVLGRFFRLVLVPPTADGMALIPAGWFTIGDTLDGDSRAIPTNVYVSAFYMDTNLVNFDQWQTVYAFATNHGYSFYQSTSNGPVIASGKAPNHPVCQVDWYDCVIWCNARSQLAGLTPVYYADAGLTQVYTNWAMTPYVNWTANGYRLPTEAEWEKAARGGLSGQRFPWGDTISEDQANYNSYWQDGVPYYSYDVNTYSGFNTNFDTGGFPYTSPVGYFAENGFGLYDMAGNLSELCWDWYAATPYPSGSPYLGGNDPRGPATGSNRVVRGGSWGGNALTARCANRASDDPHYALANYGFRCVRSP